MVEEHLRVYTDKSEFVHEDGTTEVFFEGIASTETQKRYRHIQQAFSSGFLEEQILRCRDVKNPPVFSNLTEQQIAVLDKLVSSVTSEHGRALIGLVIMQLSLKTIEPNQSIRLHKGGRSGKQFSWQGGVSMRALDKNHVTPILRKHDLLKLNADGFMMTRSLAENYPYSIVYKANIRGARQEWLLLIDDMEAGRIDTLQALLYLISQLINQATAFRQLADETMMLVSQFVGRASQDIQSITRRIINDHIHGSGYAARLMEIAMHSLLQGLHDLDGLGSLDLNPLSQMRSANKKHGNVGDIELLENGQIVEAWDAKFGKSYLRDEIEELADKLPDHPEINTAGFVTSGRPDNLDELDARMREIEELLDVKVRILSFDEWVEEQFEHATRVYNIDQQELAVAWLQAFVESIAQKRRKIAPIDEPCFAWLEILRDMLRKYPVA